ncbi:MAG: GtrA family protein [Kiritimatiellae bacterium]|nr:GtrA family protein [Kiritimatiellia bacterium]
MLTGIGSFLTDCSIYAILAKLCKFHPLIANMISRPAGGVFSFLFNKYWTFQNRGKTRTIVQFGRFGLIWFVNLGLSELLVGLFHEVVRLGPIQSKVWTEVILAGVTFTYLKLWAFR